MSRFSDDYDEDFRNQGLLWEANYQRALSGKRGQRALRTLEAALLALPEPRLISSHLALNGQVCAMGALITHQRCEAGESREQVLAELEDLAPPTCDKCWHERAAHADGRCSRCIEYTASGFGSHRCDGYVPSDESDDYGLITAQAGRDAGLTFTLAWGIAQENDNSWVGEETPEQRYQRILAWARKRILPEETAVI